MAHIEETKGFKGFVFYTVKGQLALVKVEDCLTPVPLQFVGI